MMNRNRRGGRTVLLALLAVLISAGVPCRAADWGTLQVRFVYRGEIPARDRLALDKDVDVCSKNHPREEDVVVHPANRGLQNVVVWLDVKRADELDGIHPRYRKTEQAKVVLTNQSCRFEPRVTLLRTSQTLVLGNDDPIPHSTVAFLTYNQPFNFGLARQGGKPVELKLPRAESRPALVSCPIHAWMKGFLLVQDHPYMAVSDADGRLRIPDVPAGTHVFRFWHEKSGYLKTLPVDGRKVEGKKGRFTLTLTAEAVTDLGDVALTAADFE